MKVDEQYKVITKQGTLITGQYKKTQFDVLYFDNGKYTVGAAKEDIAEIKQI